MCECLDQAMILSTQKEKERNESEQVNINKKTKRLARHCHRLSWRGSSCPQEELMAIIKKHNPASLWDLGEGIQMVMHRPYADPAKDKLDLIKNLRGYLNRFNPDDSLAFFPRVFDVDSTKIN